MSWAYLEPRKRGDTRKMQRTLTNRRLTVALSLVMVATGFVTVQPVRAQDPQPTSSNRFRVLVPTLERRGNASADFGKKVAEAVGKLIAPMPTHTPVAANEVKDALRKYKLKEEDLDCIKDRQLAVQLNAELVMCGAYQPAASGFTLDSVRFISAKTGETFEIASFTAASPQQAAQQIFSAFENYVKQISLAAFCSDYLASSQWPNALENCNQALAINPNSQVALMGKGMALYRMGMAADQSAVTDSAKLAQAAETYKKVLELNPVNQDALKQAGIIAARLGQADLSRQYFKQYMELNPGDVSVRLAIAAEASKNGDPEGALRIIEEGLATDTASVDLNTYAGHFAVAAAAKAEGDKQKQFFETAAKYYSRVYAAKAAETDPSVLQNLILADVQLDRKKEAVDIGAAAVAAKPKEAAVWVAYATALQANDNTDQALAALDSALAIDPKYPRLSLRRATALLDAGRLAEARTAFEQAVSRGGVDANEAAQAVFVEGYDRYRASDWDDALEHFAASRDLATDAAKKGQANFWSGMVYYQRGIAAAKPQNAKAARAAMPLLERALSFFQGAGVEAYAAATPGVKLSDTIGGVRKYIDFSKELIKRGQ